MEKTETVKHMIYFKSCWFPSNFQYLCEIRNRYKDCRQPSNHTLPIWLESLILNYSTPNWQNIFLALHVSANHRVVEHLKFCYQSSDVTMLCLYPVRLRHKSTWLKLGKVGWLKIPGFVSTITSVDNNEQL